MLQEKARPPGVLVELVLVPAEPFSPLRLTATIAESQVAPRSSVTSTGVQILVEQRRNRPAAYHALLVVFTSEAWREDVRNREGAKDQAWKAVANRPVVSQPACVLR